MGTRARILMLLLSTTPWCSPARAQWTETGFVADGGVLSRGVFDLQLASAANGDLFLVQESVGNATGWGIQRVTAGGTIPWGWAGVYAEESFGMASPATDRIVPDDVGGCWRVRSFFVQHVDASGVLVPPYGEDNTAWRIPAAISDAPVGACRDGADGMFVAWVSGDGLRIGRRLASGLPDPAWGASGRIFALASGSSFLSMLPDGAGGAVVLWTDDRPRAIHLLADGSPAPGWSVAGLQLADDTPDYGGHWRHQPRLFPSGVGAFTAVWVDHTTAARVVAQRFRLDGTLDPDWPSNGFEVVAPDPTLAKPTPLDDGEGGVHVLWKSNGQPRWTHIVTGGTFAPGFSSTGISPVPASAHYCENGYQVPYDLIGVPLAHGGLAFAWNDSLPSGRRPLVRWMWPDGTLISGEPEAGRVLPVTGYDPTLLAAVPDQGTAGHFLWQAAAAPFLNGSYQLWIDRMEPLAGGATGVAIALARANAEPGRVDLSWSGARVVGLQATVYRRSAGDAWSAVADIAADGTGLLTYSDEAVQPGARYGYRLGILAGGFEAFYGETWISVPSDWSFALAAPTPNPSVGRFTIAFTLASAAPAQIEVIDVTGRVVGVRDAASLGAGRHAVTFTEAAGWRPGVYLIRLAQGTRSLLTRACVVR